MSTLKFTSLTMKNFLSVGAVTQALRLDENGLTLILGSNTDANGGVSRNGAGKTTICQALCFALYGKPLTKIKIPNLVNNINGKAMHVSVEFERDGITHRVERGRKPDLMRYFVDDREQKSDDAEGENRHTQEAIDRAVGVSYGLFRHILTLNTFTQPFLMMTTGDQRQVFEELFGVLQLSHRAEALKKRVAITNKIITGERARIKATTEANNRVAITIETTRQKGRSWDALREQKIIDLRAQLNALQGIDFEEALRAFDSVDEWKLKRQALDTEYNRLEDVRSGLKAQLHRAQSDTISKTRGGGQEAAIKRHEADIERKTQEIKRRQTSVEKIEAKISKLKIDLQSSDATLCVCCGQSIVDTDHITTVLRSIESQIEAETSHLTTETSLIQGLRDDIIHANSEITTLTEDAASQQQADNLLAVELKNAVSALDEQITDIAIAIEKKSQEIEKLGSQPETMFASRDEVYRLRSAHEFVSRDIETEIAAINPHNQQLQDLTGALQTIDDTLLVDSTDRQRHEEFLLKLLTSKDSFIRKKVVDQSIAYLNARLLSYTEKLGLPHAVRFLNDLSVEISLLGKDLDFEQLSRGEMNRVILATSWSFRDIWESMNCSCNLFFIDELIDSGLDQGGCEAAVQILKSMARDRGKNIFLISHRDELQGRIDRTLLVQKENGFTELSYADM